MCWLPVLLVIVLCFVHVVSANLCCAHRYTHGAMLSGRENAAAYLYQHGKGPDPAKVDALQICTL